MRYIHLACFLFLIPFVSSAQSNYHEGYTIKLNGDTLKGYINYREWEQSPKSIDFKLKLADNHPIKFNPKNIRKFEIIGMDAYVSYAGTISMDRTHFPDLPSALDTSKRIDTIFIQQLASGRNLTLYYHNDAVKSRFFTSENNSQPVELKYHEYYNEVQQVVYSNIYKGQLLLYVNKFRPGNNKIISGIVNSQFIKRDLVPIVNDINGESNIPQKNTSERLFFGVAIVDTKTQVANVEYNSAVKNSTSIFPKISAGFDFFGNPNVQRLIFRVELSFSYIAPRFLYPVVVSSGMRANQVYEFNQYTTTVTPQLILNIYNKDRFKVYLDAGVNFNISAYANNKYTIQNSDPAVVNAYTIQKPYTLEPWWASFPVQVGIVLNKKLDFFLNYAGMAAYTKYTSFYAANQSLSVGVKFLMR